LKAQVILPHQIILQLGSISGASSNQAPHCNTDIAPVSVTHSHFVEESARKLRLAGNKDARSYRPQKSAPWGADEGGTAPPPPI
jgi:hypothetical protein